MARKVLHIPANKNVSVSTASRQRILRVAAYCRVSTEQDEQLNSFENQVQYYTEHIERNPNYEMAGIYADEGISGTSTTRREQFNRMIADCEAGKIDLVITKSISRFARNTQDCLKYSRRLKSLGIGIIFEKENINTMDGSGELLFTILSSLAQEESRSISENCQWGIRSLFKQGVLHINSNRFYGYDKDENGQLIINPEQGKTVKWLYESFMDGYSPDVLARKLNEDKVPGCMGEPKWTVDTVLGIANREQYVPIWEAQMKGDNLLAAFRAKQFLRLTKQAKPMAELDKSIVSKTFEKSIIYPMGEVEFYFLDGTVIEVDTIK